MSSVNTLPDFLEPWGSRLPGQPSSEPRYTNALFRHNRLPLSSHALWWPSSTSSTSVLLIFIPGNPGLADFYTPFLNDIHEKSDGSLPIIARAHLGHTPHIDHNEAYVDRASVGLASQIESIIELIDASKTIYDKLVLVGHSVGSWLVLQALKARPEAVNSVFLLFPTIANIGDTPNGRKLSWLFHHPFPKIISYLSICAGLLPLGVVSYLYKDWPTPQVHVLRSLLKSPSAVYASLSMADEEMKTIKEADVDLLTTFGDRIHLYFAENDNWVGEQKDLLLKMFDERHRVVHGDSDIPHAFCINHGEPLAVQCFEWLKEGGLIT
ncbi:hypothetical protein QCA50_016354 [Cerrena zonata]|uniref:Lipid droplet-associated hydrolase n=1 Tax=Cerrena zonata TaxID=2478898 RepID=A0AAW0FK67_9APHY